MSKFEMLTAMAFAAFADAPVDVAVIEVGLGGTWDATNVADAQVAVITPIGIDHTEYLGNDLAEIAAREGRDHQARTLSDDTVADRRAGRRRRWTCCCAAPSRSTPPSPARAASSRVLDRAVAVGGQRLELQGLGGVYDEIFLPLHGEHQARNAALALAAVEAFFGAGADASSTSTRCGTGFAAVTQPGPARAGPHARRSCSTPRTTPPVRGPGRGAGRRVRLPPAGRRASR